MEAATQAERLDLQAPRNEPTDAIQAEAFAAAVEHGKTLDRTTGAERVVSALAGTGHPLIK